MSKKSGETEDTSSDKQRETVADDEQFEKKEKTKRFLCIG